MTPKGMIKAIEARMKAVAKERDKIEDMIGDLDGIRDSCDRAYYALQDARDALSELV
jgi:hypothetical protein